MIKTFFSLKGVIYLNRCPNLELNEEMDRNIDKYSFLGLKFLYLISDRDINDINEFEKYFNVDKIQMNDNKLIVLNEIDAIDENGNLFDAKARQLVKSNTSQQTFYKKKLLRDWSQCKIRGIKSIIFGNRDQMILKDIGEESVDEIPERCRDNWSDVKCFQFTDRFLSFAKVCVKEELVLYEFSFDYRNRSVFCNQIVSEENNDYFLPEFFTKK